MSDQQQDEISRALDALLGKALDEAEPPVKTRRTRAKRSSAPAATAPSPHHKKAAVLTAPEDAFLDNDTASEPQVTAALAPKKKPIPITAIESTDEPEETPVAEVPAPAKKPIAINADLAALLEIKKQALTELSPLVEQLHQTPEEKFRTTMMLIQASDNAALIPEAYAAAEQIKDEKIRAQALLDVVNEINYFTQASASTE